MIRFLMTLKRNLSVRLLNAELEGIAKSKESDEVKLRKILRNMEKAEKLNLFSKASIPPR